MYDDGFLYLWYSPFIYITSLQIYCIYNATQKCSETLTNGNKCWNKVFKDAKLVSV